MKFSASRTILLNACQSVAAAVPKRATNPVFQQLLVRAGDGMARLSATNAEQWCLIQVEAEVSEPGDALLHPDRVIAILRELADDEVTVETTETSVVVRSAVSEWDLPAEDPAKYPRGGDEWDDSGHRSIPASELLAASRCVSGVPAEKEEMKQYTALHGVLWIVDQNHLSIAGTNGKHLSEVQVPLQVDGEDPHTTPKPYPIVPRYAQLILERWLAKAGDDDRVEFRFTPTQALFRLNGASVLRTALQVGRYPDHAPVVRLAEKGTVKMTVRADVFGVAWRQATLMVDELESRVTMKLSPGKMTLFTQGVAAGKSRVEAVVPYDGPEVEVMCNPGYVVKAIRVLPGSAEVDVTLSPNGATPILISWGQCRQVVMPLTTKAGN